MQLEDEPPLELSRLMAMDGNNSLKRMLPVDNREAADARVLDSEYFLPKEFVDRYANEVKSVRRGPQVKTRRSGAVLDSEDEDADTDADADADTDGDADDIAAIGETDEGDPTDARDATDATGTTTNPAPPIIIPRRD